MSRTDRLMADFVTATDTTPRMRLLFEIGVVTAVVLYLIVFAMSQTDRIAARTQLMEAFTVWLPIRAELMAYRAERGHWPAAAEAIKTDELTYSSSGTITTAVELGEGGTLTVVLADEGPVEPLKGRRLSFRPTLSAADPGAPIIWFCGSRGVPEGFMPSGQDFSDLGPETLPSACKDLPRP